MHRPHTNVPLVNRAPLATYSRSALTPNPITLTLTLTLAGDHSDIKVPYDIPTMKEKLFIWLSAAVDHLNQDWSGVEHCWKETDLLRAWCACATTLDQP